MKKYIYIALASLSALMMSCGGSNEFKVSGNIEGGSDSLAVVLESASSGIWLHVDSVEVNKNGNFSVSSEAPASPGVYRLRMGEQSIYFPIDSLDNLSIKTKLSTFATDYTLSGSDNAELMMNVDKKAIELAKSGDVEAMAAWKKDLVKQVLADPSGIVSYYLINKYVGNKPVFDPTNDADLKIIGAVANAYHTFRPTDPRTQYLVNLLLDGQRRRREAMELPAQEVMVEEIPIIEIDLQDNMGKQQKLSEVAKQGKVVILNFTMYAADFSPQYNAVLADLYKKYSSQGLEVYQVSIDPEEFVWRQAAANLPWITVLDPASIQSRALKSYNVFSVPTTFILNREGDIVERVADVTELGKAVAKYI